MGLEKDISWSEPPDLSSLPSVPRAQKSEDSDDPVVRELSAIRKELKDLRTNLSKDVASGIFLAAIILFLLYLLFGLIVVIATSR